LGRASTRIGARVPVARLRARRLFNVSLIAKAGYHRRDRELAQVRACLADV